jgi:hypothetical protein
MLPGPDHVVACPHCKALAKHLTLMSGNTFGAQRWTDGKMVAPMLPRPPAVVKCHACGECYWLEDAESVGTVDSEHCRTGRPDNPAWAAAPEVKELNEREYYKALRRGLAADRQQERELRILAWWRSNDAYRSRQRRSASGAVLRSTAWEENLKALRDLLDESDEGDRLMKAEVLRELGEFEPARQLLKGVTSDEFSAVARQFDALCEARDTRVRELKVND